MRFAFLMAFSSMVLTPAVAVEVDQARLVACHATRDAKTRLSCYDTLVNETISTGYRTHSEAVTADVPGGFKYLGNGDKVMRPFHIDGPWEAEYSCKGYCIITLYRPDGETQDMIGSAEHAGSSTYYSPISGDYYIKVVGEGAWQIVLRPVRN